MIAWQAGSDVGRISREIVDIPVLNPDFGFLAAAIIGASFNPWMVFYQQSAVIERRLGPTDYKAARWDTAAGAALTQCLTAAVLIAAAATLGRKDPGLTLTSVSQISDAGQCQQPRQHCPQWRGQHPGDAELVQDRADRRFQQPRCVQPYVPRALRPIAGRAASAAFCKVS